MFIFQIRKECYIINQVRLIFHLGHQALSIVYWRSLKTQHLDNSFNLCLEKKGGTIILIVC